MIVPRFTSVQVNRPDWIRMSCTNITFLDIRDFSGSIHSSPQARVGEKRDSRGRRQCKLHCWSTTSVTWREAGDNSDQICFLINWVSHGPQDQNKLKVMKYYFKWKIGCQQINSPITLVFLQQKSDETISFWRSICGARFHQVNQRQFLEAFWKENAKIPMTTRDERWMAGSKWWKKK